MLTRGQQLTFHWPSKNRMPWLLLSVASMFVSAYSVFGWTGAVGRIGGWTGLPQYAAELPRIQAEAERWELLAIVLPFFAALVLGFGKTSSPGSGGNQSTPSLRYPAESQAEKWAAPIVRYFTRLVISFLGSFGFFLFLLLIGFVFYKLGIHAG